MASAAPGTLVLMAAFSVSRPSNGSLSNTSPKVCQANNPVPAIIPHRNRRAQTWASVPRTRRICAAHRGGRHTNPNLRDFSRASDPSTAHRLLSAPHATTAMMSSDRGERTACQHTNRCGRKPSQMSAYNGTNTPTVAGLRAIRPGVITSKGASPRQARVLGGVSLMLVSSACLGAGRVLHRPRGSRPEDAAG